MFKILKNLMLGIIISLGTIAVAVVTAIGGFLFFAYDKAVNFVSEFLTKIEWGDLAEQKDAIIKQITDGMTDNSDLLQNQVGMGMFIAGVVVLGGFIVFGILAAIFSKKAD